MSNSNKVKFGLKNCHYAKAAFDEDGNVTYEKPIRMPGAVSLSMDPEGENENCYADDIVYYVINNNSGYSGEYSGLRDTSVRGFGNRHSGN